MDTGQTYTGDAGAMMKRIQDLTGKVTSEIQGAPAARQQMGEATLQQEGVVPPLAQERGALIQQLFEADKKMAQRYGTTGAPTYIANPLERERAMTENTAPLYGALANVNTLIGARSQVLGDAMERGMQIYQAGLEAKKLELESLYKQMDILTQLQQTEAPPREAIQAKLLLEGAYNDIKQLEEAMNGQAKGRLNGAVAKLMNEKFGTNNEITRVNALRTRLALPLQSLYGRGTSGQTGVKLLEELKDVLPDVTDEGEEVAMKLNDIKSKLLSKALDQAETYGEASLPSYMVSLQSEMANMAQTKPKETSPYKIYTGR